MELTKEQQAVIHSSGNIRINAVAGSGKTTTIIEYAKTRPENSKILYLAFNKSVKLEATKKFAEKGLSHVQVETAHSLAYRYVVRYQNKYKVSPQGLKVNEIVELLRLKGNGEKHTEYVIANHINKMLAYFCNSNKQKVHELDYLNTLRDPKAKAFITPFYDYIVMQTRILLNKMDKGEIEISHDFYLKKFQLSQPQLPYDYILFDEGQDASPAMLDVFFRQKATKVIVGDTHQQIYGWRFAVNSLEQADFKTYHLSQSFRFEQSIANLAVEVLKLKRRINEHQSTIPITGLGRSKALKTKAVIARTNLGLLLKAIEYVVEKETAQKIYFEGNIQSYTYAEEGASLYDVLNLYNRKKQSIRDSLIKGMKDLEELEEYIEKTGDVQLSMMLEIVKKYGNNIHNILKTIKEKHVENDDKAKADMIFSTVHRCKGMEYDSVELVNDFLTKEMLEKIVQKEDDNLDVAKLNEEINLLYVAVTRTKNKIYIPETLIPNELLKSAQIQVLKVNKEEKNESLKFNKAIKDSIKSKTQDSTKEKAYDVESIRNTHNGAYRAWTTDLDDELTIMFYKGASINEMANHFGRTKGAIISRIKKLELEELYD
ncbi:MAG: DNA helicase [Cytophagales bacterium]|nr:MAG: DNA helicase [Cytophagales bacterium]TAF59307.1 MAG: DNA helicase [Cytophagales bacterium]